MFKRGVNINPKNFLAIGQSQLTLGFYFTHPREVVPVGQFLCTILIKLVGCVYFLLRIESGLLAWKTDKQHFIKCKIEKKYS